MQKTPTITKSFKIQRPLYDQLIKISNARGVTFSRLVIESLEEKTVSITSPKKDYSVYSGLLSNDDAKLFDQGIKESRFISKERKEVDFTWLKYFGKFPDDEGIREFERDLEESRRGYKSKDLEL